MYQKCRLTEASTGGLIPGRFSYMGMMLMNFGHDPSASSKSQRITRVKGVVEATSDILQRLL